jgi:hypothetical protein
LRAAGEYLGYIIVAMRATVQYLHGPGGVLEGEEINWGMAFGLAVSHASQYIEDKDGDG